MATTSRLTITKIEESQADKEVTANTAFDKLDKAIAGELVHDMASDADYTLVTTDVGGNENLNAVLHITDTGVNLTTTRNIIVPTLDKIYIVKNATAQSLVFKTSAGSGVTVGAGDEAFVRCDGTNVVTNNIGTPGGDTTAIHDDTAAEISAVTEKTTPVAADFVLIEDSAASNAKKRVQVGNLPATGQRGFCIPVFGSDSLTAGTHPR